jgi:hypothetical protein
MTVEFVAVNPSSGVHIGPPVPIGGWSDSTVTLIVNVKTIMFLISSVIQIFMYIGIFCNCITIPEEENEDIISKNEAFLFCYGNKSYELTQTNRRNNSLDLDDLADLNFTPQPVRNSLTLAFIENAYIIFWISKDLFWSWGTGDLTKGRDLAIMYESFAMCFGLLSIFIYILTAYLYRRNLVRLIDCITTIFWISANYIWMCGEFFLRYDNLTYDDANEGNDTGTRIASAICFSFGLVFQGIACAILYYNHRENNRQQQQILQRRRQNSNESDGSSSHDALNRSVHDRDQDTVSVQLNPMIEMTQIVANQTFKYDRLFVSLAPQHGNKKIEDIDQEELVLF